MTKIFKIYLFFPNLILKKILKHFDKDTETCIYFIIQFVFHKVNLPCNIFNILNTKTCIKNKLCLKTTYNLYSFV